MFHILSIGTNISPKINAVRIVKQLCLYFGSVVIYPFVFTKPETIHSKNDFLNSLAIIESKMEVKEIKSALNKIESFLGRDKTDPNSSVKDRTADIDIIHSSLVQVVKQEFLSEENYLMSVFNVEEPIDLSDYGLPAIYRPTTVNIDRTTSKIVIINDKIDCL